MGVNKVQAGFLVCVSIFVLKCSVVSAVREICDNPATDPFDCINLDDEIRSVIDNLDWGDEFNKIAGISIGGVVALLIVLIIVPNLLIMGLIFLCCYCCRCGAFYRLRYENDSPYRVATMNVHGASPRPPVPPKPQSDAPWNNNKQKSNWPWNRNGSPEARNEGFRTQY